jgi:serine/threonine protein kinase
MLSDTNVSAGKTVQVGLADYDLLRRIGAGSYGDVWLARDAVGKAVAIKIIDRERLALVSRANREERALGLLRTELPEHPHLIRVHHVGNDGPRLYYVMDLADDASLSAPQAQAGGPSPAAAAPGSNSRAGAAPHANLEAYRAKTLTDLTTAGPMLVGDAIAVVRQLLDAVRCLHEHGIVHRDIKPSNILLVGGVWKLADIGLMAEEATAMTTLGTPDFMPPTGKIDRTTDLYALGKLLYCLTTGNPARAFPSIPQTLLTRDGRRRIAAVNDVITRACHIRPEHRFLSAQAMDDALAQCLRNDGRSAAWLKFLIPALGIGLLVVVLVAWRALVPRAGSHEPSGPAWVDRSVVGPSPRSRHALAFDSSRGVTVLFGGDNAGETWEWDGQAWLLRTAKGPPPGSSLAMAFDSARHVALLVAGTYMGAQASALWAWDGESWTELAVGGPPPRSEFAVAFDQRRGALVLFGGVRGAELLGDTWEWDGSTWVQKTPGGPAPVPRFAHGMAYDAGRERTILFGGRYNELDSDAETWEWDGVAWERLATSGPSPRGYHGMAYDTAQRRITLFGGAQRGGWMYFGDTWAWDGNTWTLIASAGPHARHVCALAYDDRRQAVVLFGGEYYDGEYHRYGDTWEMCTAGGATQPAHANSSSQPAAWVSLFNGADLTGWYQELPNQGQWVVENGVIHCERTAEYKSLLSEQVFGSGTIRATIVPGHDGARLGVGYLCPRGPLFMFMGDKYTWVRGYREDYPPDQPGNWLSFPGPVLKTGERAELEVEYSPQRVVLKVNGVVLQELPGVNGEGHIALHVWREDAGGFTDIAFRPARR